MPSMSSVHASRSSEASSKAGPPSFGSSRTEVRVSWTLRPVSNSTASSRHSSHSSRPGCPTPCGTMRAPLMRAATSSASPPSTIRWMASLASLRCFALPPKEMETKPFGELQPCCGTSMGQPVAAIRRFSVLPPRPRTAPMAATGTSTCIGAVGSAASVAASVRMRCISSLRLSSFLACSFCISTRCRAKSTCFSASAKRMFAASGPHFASSAVKMSSTSFFSSSKFCGVASRTFWMAARVDDSAAICLRFSSSSFFLLCKASRFCLNISSLCFFRFSSSSRTCCCASSCLCRWSCWLACC
mmetsp:Transcript_5215/g.15532  ORF Transcript_5215/g.15532 Transcript_5215/m.15532 type:complete len:301 (-) Transcript_5215:74-976(-)